MAAMNRISTLVQATRAERRRSPRRRVLKAGQILSCEERDARVCHVLDLSDSGARLRIPEAPGCPDLFTLKIDSAHPRACEQVWSAGELLGVRFQ